MALLPGRSWIARPTNIWQSFAGTSPETDQNHPQTGSGETKRHSLGDVLHVY